MEAHEDEIRRRVLLGDTYEEIGSYLQIVDPCQTGNSSRSVRRFCSERGIRRIDLADLNPVSDEQLDYHISQQVQLVGHVYGKRSMDGLLRSLGIMVSESRVGESLERIYPAQHHMRRQNIQRSLNPHPYSASYFGEKLHFDQNVKLAMYGATHVVCIDGYSRLIVGFLTIPRKNPVLIYEHLFAPLLSTHGLWDQIRMDHGTEFTLIATVQQALAREINSHRLDGGQFRRHPVFRSTSRQNHRVEKLWVEVNRRINYPIKEILVRMEGEDEINMTDELTKFCVSHVTIMVITCAVKRFMCAWNSHRIPGRNGGIPSVLARINNRTSQIHSHQIPNTEAAVALHESEHCQLSRDLIYGNDPIMEYLGLQNLRERDFEKEFPSMDSVFQDILHGHGTLFKTAIHFFIN